MNDFDSWLKLNSLVLRHMTVSLEKKPDKYIEKTSVSEVAEGNDTQSPSDNNDNKIDVKNKKIIVMISGGNIDLSLFNKL